MFELIILIIGVLIGIGIMMRPRKRTDDSMLNNGELAIMVKRVKEYEQ